MVVIPPAVGDRMAPERRPYHHQRCLGPAWRPGKLYRVRSVTAWPRISRSIRCHGQPSRPSRRRQQCCLRSTRCPLQPGKLCRRVQRPRMAPVPPGAVVGLHTLRAAGIPGCLGSTQTPLQPGELCRPCSATAWPNLLAQQPFLYVKSMCLSAIQGVSPGSGTGS